MMGEKNAPFSSPLQSMKVKNPKFSKGVHIPGCQKIPHICTSKVVAWNRGSGTRGGVEELPTIPSCQRIQQQKVLRCRWLWPRGCRGSMTGAMGGPWLAPAPSPSLAAPGWKQQYQRSQTHWWGDLASCSPSSWGGAYDLGDSRCMEAPTTRRWCQWQ